MLNENRAVHSMSKWWNIQGGQIMHKNISTERSTNLVISLYCLLFKCKVNILEKCIIKIPHLQKYGIIQGVQNLNHSVKWNPHFLHFLTYPVYSNLNRKLIKTDVNLPNKTVLTIKIWKQSLISGPNSSWFFFYQLEIVYRKYSNLASIKKKKCKSLLNQGPLNFRIVVHWGIVPPRNRDIIKESDAY